jgi:hypothetical protein
VGSNVPFVGDTTQYFVSIGVGMFKDPSLMGIFPLPLSSPTAHIATINMIRHLLVDTSSILIPGWYLVLRMLIHMEYPFHSPWSRLLIL